MQTIHSTNAEDVTMPGDAEIAKKDHISPWQYLGASLAFAVLAVGLVAWAIFDPESSVRMPWIFAVILNLLGPFVSLGLLVLASLASFIAGIRAFFRR